MSIDQDKDQEQDEAHDDARAAAAEARMAEAEALLDVATRQLAIAARNIANANAAEREYRRTIWHYSQLMRHRISNPLQTIIGMVDTLRSMPDLDREQRLVMLDAIAEQARVLRDTSLEPRALAPSERELRPAPLRAVVRVIDEPEADAPDKPRSPFSRFPPSCDDI